MSCLTSYLAISKLTKEITPCQFLIQFDQICYSEFNVISLAMFMTTVCKISNHILFSQVFIFSCMIQNTILVDKMGRYGGGPFLPGIASFNTKNFALAYGWNFFKY